MGPNLGTTPREEVTHEALSKVALPYLAESISAPHPCVLRQCLMGRYRRSS